MFGVLGACGCLQRRGLGVALAGVRVWSADVDDGVVPEYAAPAVHDDVALPSAAVAVIGNRVLWDILMRRREARRPDLKYEPVPQEVVKVYPNAMTLDGACSVVVAPRVLRIVYFRI